MGAKIGLRGLQDDSASIIERRNVSKNVRKNVGKNVAHVCAQHKLS